MAIYYFDTYDDGDIITDEDGLDLPDLEAVKVEAARGLADMARDVLPGSIRRELAVVARDEQSRHVLRSMMTFEAIVLL